MISSLGGVSEHTTWRPATMVRVPRWSELKGVIIWLSNQIHRLPIILGVDIRSCISWDVHGGLDGEQVMQSVCVVDHPQTDIQSIALASRTRPFFNKLFNTQIVF